MTIAVSAAKKSIITSVLLVGLILVASGHVSAKQTTDIKIKTWPTPKFPMLAAWLGLEGHCDVRFGVDEKGFAFAVAASCTRRIFCFEAKRAVSEATFEPKTIDGVPSVRTNVVFPLEFFLDGSSYDKDDDPRPLELCEMQAVS